MEGIGLFFERYHKNSRLCNLSYVIRKNYPIYLTG